MTDEVLGGVAAGDHGEEAAEPLQQLAPVMKDAPIAPAHGIAAIALQMALKYHDIGTVKDGALYQQYKIEGKNLVPLHLDMVFETAIRIEAHVLGASERIAKIVVDALEAGIADDVAREAASDLEQQATASDHQR